MTKNQDNLPNSMEMTLRSNSSLSLDVEPAFVVDTFIASQEQKVLILLHGLPVLTLCAARMPPVALRLRTPSSFAPTLTPTPLLLKLCVPSSVTDVETQLLSISTQSENHRL